jgi:predicted deacetylase
VGVQSEASRGGRGLAHVVALRAATGHKDVAPVLERVSTKVAELARFVAAEREAGEIVAFHAHAHAEDFRKPRRVLDRRGEGRELGCSCHAAARRRIQT